LYKNAAFLAIPSRSEVMSMVALEAAAMGTPVLLTDRCGFDEVQEVGGGLVVAADVENLAAGLQKMIAEARNRTAMGERLRAFVLAQYAWPRVAGQLRHHLAQLAGLELCADVAISERRPASEASRRVQRVVQPK
jgi:glycosyltransferase involved in cell wall biosynthesis